MTTLAALAVSLGVARESQRPTPSQLLLAVSLAVMTAAAHRFPLELSPRTKITTDTAPAFVGVILLDPLLAIAASAAGIAVGELLRRTAWVQTLYNTAVATLRSAAGLAALGAAASTPLAANVSIRTALAGIALAAGAMYVSTAALVDAIISIQQRSNPARGWWQRRRPGISFEAALYLTGALTAFAGLRWSGAVLLIVPPTVLIHRALRDGAALRRQTQTGLERIADEAEARVPAMAGHSLRVAATVRLLAARLRLGGEVADVSARAALLQHLGLQSVRSAVLLRPDPLAGEEWSEIQVHPEAGARMLAVIPGMADVAAVVLTHHERWDGRGYPQGLQGGAIPIAARVLAVADAYHAMLEPRPYRPALPRAVVREELVSGAGSQFDPTVVRAMLALMDTAQTPSRDSA